MHPNTIIENILDGFRGQIGPDFELCKDLVYRVFSNFLMMDTDRVSEEKYAFAASFHDYRILTSKTFDYLVPTEPKAKRYSPFSFKGNIFKLLQAPDQSAPNVQEIKAFHFLWQK